MPCQAYYCIRWLSGRLYSWISPSPCWLDPESASELRLRKLGVDLRFRRCESTLKTCRAFYRQHQVQRCYVEPLLLSAKGDAPLGNRQRREGAWLSLLHTE